jgi:hypothetical protein
MSSTESEEYEAPSTEVALREEVQELRGELEQLRTTAGAPARVIPRSLDEWVLVVRDYNLLAQSLAKTAFVPMNFRGRPDQITAVMMYGREIGLPPMTTLQNTYEVHGRVGMYAEQLRAMILDAGHDFTIDEMNSDRCVLSGQRRGKDRWETFTYTMDQAKSAGLYAQNEQYRKRPVEMLFARCTGIMAHAMFPDVIRGMSSVEELQDVGESAAEAPPAGELERPAPAKVGRKRAASRQVEASQKVENQATPQVSEPVIPAEPGLPPLPGEAAAPTSVTDEPKRMDVGEALGDVVEPERCHVIYNGVQCSRPVHGAEMAHYFDSAFASEGDGSPDDVAATGTDEAYERALEAQGADSDLGLPDRTRDEYPVESGPVADKPKPMHSAQTKALQARFKGLGFTDEPDDREQRLRVAAAIVGHDVDTFRATGDNAMTYDEANEVLRVLAPARSREDVIEIMVKIAQGEHP